MTTPLRVGIGGPVGSGKTALVEALCKRLREISRSNGSDLHTLSFLFWAFQ